MLVRIIVNRAMNGSKIFGRVLSSGIGHLKTKIWAQSICNFFLSFFTSIMKHDESYQLILDLSLNIFYLDESDKLFPVERSLDGWSLLLPPPQHPDFFWVVVCESSTMVMLLPRALDPLPPFFGFSSDLAIICCVRSRKSSSMPRFSLAEVWWCLAPTERAYLKQKINTRMFKGLDNTRVEKWKTLAWKNVGNKHI